MNIYPILLAVCQTLSKDYDIPICIDPANPRYYKRGQKGNSVTGLFNPPINETDEPIIIIYLDGMKDMINYVTETDPSFDPTCIQDVCDVCVRTVNHEYRHYLQWKWLTSRGYDFAKVSKDLEKQINYKFDPLEIDARNYEMGNIQNIDDAMEKMIKEWRLSP